MLNTEDIDLSQTDSNGMTICGLAYQMQQISERSDAFTQAEKDLATNLFKKVIKRLAASKYKL